MTITSNEAGTYCVNTSATSTTDCTFTGSITAGGSITTSAFTTKGDYYAHVTDGAGYVSHSSKVTIALSPPSLGEYIIDNSISGLDKTIIDGDTLYRFSGTSGNTGINNYICLGTTTKCASGSENMYRIIGVEPSTGYVKVIKQIKYGSTKWSSSSQVTWPNSDAYSTMVTWYNSVSFKSMIVSHTWNIGYVNGTANSYIGTRELVISYEDDTSTTAYVGMLALSDYYLAYQGDLHWHSNSNYTSNWIHLGNNGNTSDVEWTMTRYGIFGWGVYFRFAASGGVVGYTSVSNSLAVRPVFYLDSDIYRISGSGTSDDPFLVSE